VAGVDWCYGSYGAGLAFTLGHFMFAPWILPSVARIKEDGGKGQVSGDMRVWLRVHVWRSIAVDLPGFICFLVAVLKAIHL
jgi:hypothetical protein